MIMNKILSQKWVNRLYCDFLVIHMVINKIVFNHDLTMGAIILALY